MPRPRAIRLWWPTDPRRARHRGWVDCTPRDLAARHAAAAWIAEEAGVPVEIVRASCADLAEAARAIGVDPDTPAGRAAAVATMRGRRPPKLRDATTTTRDPKWCKECRTALAADGATRCESCARERAEAVARRRRMVLVEDGEDAEHAHGESRPGEAPAWAWRLCP